MSKLFRAGLLAALTLLPFAARAVIVTVDGAGLTLSNVPYTGGETYILDNVPPAAPTSFAATPTGSDVALTWTNPSTDFASATIRRSTSGYPATISDGTLVVQGTTGTSRTDASLADGTYYYSIFALDAVGNISSSATAMAVVDTSVPLLNSIAGPADGTYYEGQQLNFTVTYSKALTVTGTPSISLTIGSTAREAVYVASASTSTTKVFRYIVQSGDVDSDGIASASPIALNGGSIKDSLNNNAPLTFTPPDTSGVRVSNLLPSVALLTRQAGTPSTSGDGSSTNLLQRGAFSADGRYLVFSTTSGNLVAGDTDANAGKEDVYLADLVSGTLTLVSHVAGSATTTADDLSYAPAISADGNWVTYVSAGTNIVSGQTGGNSNIFLWNRATNTNYLVSTSLTDTTFTEGEGTATIAGATALLPAAGIAQDSNFVYVLYRSQALDSGTNLYQVKLSKGNLATRTRRLVSHTNASVSTAAGGVSTNNSPSAAGQPVMSADGRYVAFMSTATNLVVGQDDTNAVNDVFLWDRDGSGVNDLRVISHVASQATKTSSVGTGTTAGRPAISADGQWVAWMTNATDIVTGQVDFTSSTSVDVFLYEVASGNNLLVSRAAGSAVTANSGNNSAFGLPTISDDGRYVSFTALLSSSAGMYGSGVTPFVSGSTSRSLFTFDRVAAAAYPSAYVLTVSSMSGAAANTATNLSSTTPWSVMSADGQVALFNNPSATTEAGFTDGNTIGGFDGSLVLLQGDTARITTRSGVTAATTANGQTSAMAINGNGSVIALLSSASDLVAGFTDNSGGADLFIYRHTRGTVGEAFNYTLVADGTITSATLAGTLPAGLSFNSSTGVISGTPTTAGNAALFVTATTASGTVSSPLAITIGKATLAVNLANLAATYDGSTKTVTGSTSPSVSSIAYTYNASATAPSAVGSYTVAAKISDANYRGTTYGTLAIGKGAATVALGNLAPTYNGLPQAATVTTTPSSIPVTSITYNSSATVPTAAGSYTVAVTVSNASYEGTTTGTLVISPAPLTVTADGASRSYGGVDPTFGATITGFVNGETIATVSGAPGFSTNASAGSNVGSYSITPSVGTLSAANYSFSTFTPGTLSITKAPVTVTADAASRVYGAANPAFTATITGFVNGQTLGTSGITGQAAVSTTATTSTGVGSATLTSALGTLASGNYSFTTFNPGTLTITKAPLTVTADAQTKVYGAANPTFTATITGFANGQTLGTSGVSGQPSVTSTATNSTGAGSATITVAVGSLTAANYSFTTFTPGTLTISKAPLSVSAASTSKVYGAANPSFTANITGFVNSETLGTSGVTGSATLATTATSASPVDTYPITVTLGSLASANYTFNGFTAGVLTVTKAPLTVTADNLSRGYRSPNPTFTATVAGFVNGDTLNSATTGAPVLDSVATLASDQGNYPITVALGTLAAANYEFTPVDGTLTVTHAVLAVTADAKSKVFGSANPAFTYTITGFLDSDTIAVVNGDPALNTSATTNSAAGDYDIEVDPCGMTATNYIFQGVNGTLTVTKASLTVTAQNESKVYGTANPSFTPVITGFANGETLGTSGVTGTPAITTTATTNSAVGTYAITTAVGSLSAPNYDFTFAPGTLTVTSASAQIALASLSQTYNGQPRAATATTTPTGLTYTLTYAGSGTAPTNAGTYAVTATISDPNYTGSTTGTLTIAQASQTITFNAPSNLTVSTPVTLTATASSGLPVTFSLVSGSATLNGASLTVSSTSAVVVRASQAGNGNYLPATQDRTISASNKLTQTITFPALTDHAAYEDPFDITATASSGLAVSFTVINGPAIMSGSTVVLTGDTGLVEIRATQAGNAQYAAAPAVTRSFYVSEEGTDIFFGDVDNSSSQKVGDIAATLPVGSKTGTLMIVAPDLGVNTVNEFTLNPDGTFVTTITVNTSTPPAGREENAPPVAREVITLTIRGQVSGGTIYGRIDELNLSFTSSILPRDGFTAAIAGYYPSSALNSSSGSTQTIVGTEGQILVVATSSNVVAGGTGAVGTDGTFTVTIPGVSITGAVDAATTTVSGILQIANQPPVNFSGVSQGTTRTDRLVNLSSRARIQPTNDGTLITGFVIGGNAPKRMLLRAVGPGLRDFGVSETLRDPRIAVHNAAGQRILENNDWSGFDVAAAFSQVGAFALAPGSKDAALLVTLDPGIYTMLITGDGQPGVVLAEVYDASTSSEVEYQRLINISSRGTVESNEGVLIGGFVVTGNAPKRVLVRGVGPALVNQNVSGVLADPRLTIYQRGTVVAQNDDWGTPVAVGSQVVANATEIAAVQQRVGAQPYAAGSKDAAIVITLAPGVYTAQVSSATGATGVALVEIYEIPE